MTTPASWHWWKDEARPAPVSAHPVAVSAWTGAGLPRGVWLAGRPARRFDRLAGDLAGRRVPGADRPRVGNGAGGLLAAADRLLA